MLDAAASAVLAVAATVLAVGTLLVLRSAWRHRAALAQTDALRAQAESVVAELSLKVSTLEGRLDAACASLVEAGDRLRLLGQRIDILESRQPAHGSYDDAIRLVRQGAAAGRLMEELGLTAMEAELIAQLHGAGSATPLPATPRRRVDVN